MGISSRPLKLIGRYSNSNNCGELILPGGSATGIQQVLEVSLQPEMLYVAAIT